MQSKIAAAANRATNELNQAKKLSVPDEVKKAQQYFEWAMQARSDGISGIANQVQPALSNATSKDAVNQIAAEMARFYASDVAVQELRAATDRRRAQAGAGSPPAGRTRRRSTATSSSPTCSG